VTGVAVAIAIVAIAALAWPVMHMSEREVEAARVENCIISDDRECERRGR